MSLLDALDARLASTPPDHTPTRGDFGPTGMEGLAPAAVLIPIIARADPTILFTRRSEGLPRHPGQVSFPGGRAHASDASLVMTALREMEEEVGIGPDFVRVAGFLDVYETGTGYAILPVVGIVREGFALTACADEVAEIFEVPLAFLLDPANRKLETGIWRGRERSYYAFRFETHYIWGATASMLVDLADRLHDAPR